jgi:uncharacterized membrane protein
LTLLLGCDVTDRRTSLSVFTVLSQWAQSVRACVCVCVYIYIYICIYIELNVCDYSGSYSNVVVAAVVVFVVVVVVALSR